jgi:hypothetical protein
MTTVASISGTVSLLISVLALGVALGTLAWSVASFWLSGARFRVDIRYGFRGAGAVVSKPEYDPSVDSLMVSQGFTEEVFGVQVRNVGRAAGTVTGWTIRVAGFGYSNPRDPLNPSLPRKIDSGETESWWGEARAIYATISAARAIGPVPSPVRVHAEVDLGTGKTLRTTVFLLP